MTKQRVVQLLVWALVIVSPVLSVCLIGLMTGTSPLAIDAWNTTLNDEQSYSSVVQQMRLYGAPQGVSGYDEVMAARLSWGAYAPFVFYPLYAGSFLTGIDSHNFIYLINMGYGVIAALLIVVFLKPNVRESFLCAALFLFQFIVARYFASGMAEASYVTFAALVACGCVWAVRVCECAQQLSPGRHARQGVAGGTAGADDGGNGTEHIRGNGRTSARSGKSSEPNKPGVRIAVLFVVMVVAIGFWGVMRPYLLAFVLLPLALLLVDDCGLSKAGRVGIALFSAVVMAAALAAFVYFGKYYVAPYFGGGSIGASLPQLLVRALGDFASINLDALLFTGKSFVKLSWIGIMTAWFALEWVVLLIMAVGAWRNGRKRAFAVQGAALIAGFALYEANILLYSPRQLHRTLIAVAVAYAILIVFLRDPKPAKRKVSARLVMVCFVSLACTGSVLLYPSQFSLPQVSAETTVAQEDDARLKLTELMPRADDPWDNTVAHPIENTDFQVYFCLPTYQSLNCCQKGYLKTALEQGTLKSRYVSLPLQSDLNKVAAKYQVIYEGLGHRIYQVR